MAPSGGLIVELFGTKFSLTLGGWRFRLAVAIEDLDPIVDRPNPALQHEPVANGRL
jgi:hypothetical protein